MTRAERTATYIAYGCLLLFVIACAVVTFAIVAGSGSQP